MAVLTTVPYTLTVLTNDGAGHLVQGFVLPLSSTGGCNWLTVADLNGDGRPDLAAAPSATSNTVAIFTNNGSSGFRGVLRHGRGCHPLMICAADA